MKFPLGKEKRAAYSRRIKAFWLDYRRNKIGLVGIAILTMFVFLAVFAPWLTPHDPTLDKRLAQGLAMPEWITIFPQYNDLPPTLKLSVDWSVIQGSEIIDVEQNEELVIRYNGGQNADIYVGWDFIYLYSSPKMFTCEFTWEAKTVEAAGYSLELVLFNSTNYRYSLWDNYYCAKGRNWLKKTSEIPFLEKEKISLVQVRSTNSRLLERLGLDPLSSNLAKLALSEKDEYGLLMHIRFMSKSENSTCEICLKDTILDVPGLVHGLLGTDLLGRDVFSQLVFGAGISLVIGLLTAILATSIGVIVGVVSGYVGGALDEFLMRTVDTLLCLPVLPLLLALMYIFGLNVYYIIVLLALFGWQGLARVVRSQVLSLRERPFVESAKAVGAGKLHIVLEHIVPNVLPVAFAAMVLSVPAAIIAEAGLSFLGFGDPSSPTWGRMLYEARQSDAFRQLAWWWVVPPGLAITLISLSFIFIGQAVDESVNPRLRRRR